MLPAKQAYFAVRTTIFLPPYWTLNLIESWGKSEKDSKGEEQRRLLSDWLSDFVVFSLLTARKGVNKDGCQSQSSPSFHRSVSFVQDGMERFTKCDVFLSAYSTYRGRWQLFYICVYCWVRCKKNSSEAKYIVSDGKFLIYKMLQ